MNKKLIIIIVLLNVSLLYPISHAVRQMVKDWPEGYDATGVHWYVYDIYHAETHILNENSVGSYTQYSAVQNAARWTADVGNFSGGDWQEGDTIIGFGSWDSAYVTDPSGYGDNPNHTGFYWLFSDTLDADVDPQTLSPADTVRQIPKPLVSKTGPGGGAVDTIWVKIPNPMETRRAEPTEYDVLGYWLWADSTGTGTPNAFNGDSAMEIAFIPVSGVYEDTTVFWMLESDSFQTWNTWTVYFAYKLVANPDITVTESPGSPGYSTYYFSQNSDPITVYQNVIGVEENKNPKIKTSVLQFYPNPFLQSTKIVFSTPNTTPVKITVYNSCGQLIRTLLDEIRPAGKQTIEYNGIDENGIDLPSGVYFYLLQTPNQQHTGRLTKIR